jgi:predicted enzyme related to lactoylglutathione lyase
MRDLTTIALSTLGLGEAAASAWHCHYTDNQHSHYKDIDSKELLRYSAVMIKHIKFATIPVRDQDQAIEFYTRKLGFTVFTDQPMGPGHRWIELNIPGSKTGLVLFTPDGFEDRIGKFTGISFECDDVHKTYEDLVKKGVEFIAPPKTESWGTSALFKDVDGNQFVMSTR